MTIPCIFCEFKADTLAALKEHSATCAEHPAVKEVASLQQHIKSVLDVSYLPCDQTIQCPACGEAWWNRPEAINENWHAEGCPVFAAQLAVGMSVDVRHGMAPMPFDPWEGRRSEAKAEEIQSEVQDLRAALAAARAELAETPPTLEWIKQQFGEPTAGSNGELYWANGVGIIRGYVYAPADQHRCKRVETRAAVLASVKTGGDDAAP